MKNGLWMAMMLAVAVFASGCGDKGSAPAKAEKHADSHEGHDHDAKTASSKADDHDHTGWWCNEHGVPEEVCAQCNSKLAAEFQKKGDWCKEHDRPDSQCFVCHPDYEAKFAAQYEAKYGKKPPARTE